MPVTIIDTLQRGGSGLSPFPVIKEDDARLSYLTVADLASRDLIPEWKRLPFMRVHVIGEATDYRLGVDVTIAGQVWTEVADGGGGGGSEFQLLSEKNQPLGYVGLEANTKINPIYIDNIYSNNSYVVTTLAQRNALTTGTGDIVHTTGTSQIFVKLNDNPPTNTDADFAELLFPGAVLSVNGQVGVVTISIASLLTVPANVTDLNNFINSSSSVLALNAVTATHTTQIAALQADVAALQGLVGSAAIIPTYAPASVYSLNQAVKFLETSGRYNLYVANAAIAAGETPGVDPDWLRIGDYYTTAETTVLLSNKADLVGGVVPINQSNPATIVMTYIAANLAARNAITPTTNMRVYVTANQKAYIYSPGHPLADAEGFVEEIVTAGNIYTVDGTLTGNRTVTGAGFNLNFTGLNIFQVTAANFILKPDGGIFAGSSTTTANYNFGVDNVNNGAWGAIVGGLQSVINAGVGSAIAVGEAVLIRRYGSQAFGRSTRINASAPFSFIAGGWIPTGTDPNTNDKVPQAGGFMSFGFYGTDSGQIDNHGALGNFSAILGGFNHNIPADSHQSVILGGAAIKARAADPNQVYVPNFNIVTAPAAGTTAHAVLVRDGTTGSIKTVAQATLTANIYTADGTLTSPRTLTGDGLDLTFTGLGVFDVIAGTASIHMNTFGAANDITLTGEDIALNGNHTVSGMAVTEIGFSVGSSGFNLQAATASFSGNTATVQANLGNLSLLATGHVNIRALAAGHDINIETVSLANSINLNSLNDINLNATDDLLLNGVSGTTGQFIGNVNGHAVWATIAAGGISSANNGLTLTASTVQLGGPLVQTTTISGAFTFNLTTGAQINITNTAGNIIQRSNVGDVSIEALVGDISISAGDDIEVVGVASAFLLSPGMAGIASETLIDFTAPQFTLQGAAAASPTTMFFRGDGTWAVPAGGGGGGHVIEDEGTPLIQRTNLNFVGSGVVVTDIGGKTTVTIAGGSGTASLFFNEYFTGNGVTTVFTLTSVDPVQIFSVFVGGQKLREGVHYTKNDAAKTVTISPAVATGIGIDVGYFTSLSSVASLPNWDEGTWGLARIATQAETNAGLDDSRGVTPLKLAVWAASFSTALYEYACSDEVSTLTTGLKLTVRSPKAFTLTGVRVSLVTAQATGSLLTVDVRKNGVTVLSTLITVDNTETTSFTAAVPPVISVAAIANDDILTFHVTQVGDGTATGLKIKLYG